MKKRISINISAGLLIAAVFLTLNGCGQRSARVVSAPPESTPGWAEYSPEETSEEESTSEQQETNAAGRPQVYAEYNEDDFPGLKAGWYQTEDGWYYFDEGLRMLTDWQEIDGETYYFGSDGLMYADTVIEGRYVDKDGKLQDEIPDTYAEPSGADAGTAADGQDAADGATAGQSQNDAGNVTAAAQAQSAEKQQSKAQQQTKAQQTQPEAAGSTAQTAAQQQQQTKAAVQQTSAAETKAAAQQSQSSAAEAASDSESSSEDADSSEDTDTEADVTRSGWYKTDSGMYHYNSSLSKDTGWTTIDDRSYYFDSDGKLVTNSEVDGYYLDSNGVRTKKKSETETTAESSSYAVSDGHEASGKDPVTYTRP